MLKKKMLKMGDYNRDLIAVQVLLLSCALHCVLSSVGMTCLISFFCWGGDLTGGVTAVILRARGGAALGSARRVSGTPLKALR